MPTVTGRSWGTEQQRFCDPAALGSARQDDPGILQAGLRYGRCSVRGDQPQTQRAPRSAVGWEQLPARPTATITILPSEPRESTTDLIERALDALATQGKPPQLEPPAPEESRSLGSLDGRACVPEMHSSFCSHFSRIPSGCAI